MVRQEVVILYYDADTPTNVAIQNGHTTFYRLKKMSKDDVAELLGATNTDEHEPQSK